jgi:hypothetical protein
MPQEASEPIPAIGFEARLAFRGSLFLKPCRRLLNTVVTFSSCVRLEGVAMGQKVDLQKN